MRELLALIKRHDLYNLFCPPTHNPFVQFFRYMFVGGIATIVDLGVFYILDSNRPEWLYFSTGAAFAAGLLVSYLLSKHFVFTDVAVHSKLTEFLIYFITGIIGLGLSELIMFLFASRLDLNHMLTKIAATAVVFLWNFGSKKIILYRKRHFE